MFDWVPKFRDQMDEVLATDQNDVTYTDERRNQIVVFKSCYTEARWVGEGGEPGSATGPARTLANYKAHMRAVLPELAKRPGVLFVYLTIPPLSPHVAKEPLWKYLMKSALGRPHNNERIAMQGAISRKAANWAKAPDGWLAGYPHDNVVVFDYYDILTDGSSNLSRFVTADGDNHPTAAGNQRAARALVPLLNRAVHRAGLGGEVARGDAPAVGPT
jgi:hypothetical protein